MVEISSNPLINQDAPSDHILKGTASFPCERIISKVTWVKTQNIQFAVHRRKLEMHHWSCLNVNESLTVETVSRVISWGSGFPLRRRAPTTTVKQSSHECSDSSDKHYISRPQGPFQIHCHWSVSNFSLLLQIRASVLLFTAFKQSFSFSKILKEKSHIMWFMSFCLTAFPLRVPKEHHKKMFQSYNMHFVPHHCQSPIACLIVSVLIWREFPKRFTIGTIRKEFASFKTPFPQNHPTGASCHGSFSFSSPLFHWAVLKWSQNDINHGTNSTHITLQ